METIKKIILSFDGAEEIKRIIVVGENEIERYTNKILSNVKLLKVYTEYVRKLKEQNKEQLEGLDNQAKINKLAKLGKIEKKDNVIINVTEYDNPIKFIISYEEEQKEVKEETNSSEYTSLYNEMLDEICKTYDIDSSNREEAISKLKQLGLYQKHESKKTLKEIIKENKINNFIVNHKVLSGLLGTGILALMVYGGVKLSKTTHQEDSNEKPAIGLLLPENIEKPDFTFETLEVPETTIPTLTPIPEVVEYVPEIYIENENTYFPGYEEPSSKSILLKEVDGFESLSQNESIDTLYEIRNENMASIGNKIQSNISFKDKGMYIYFENLFNDYDLSDKAYVKYFSMLGNQIIKCAYQDENYDINEGVNKYSKISCYEVVRCIRDNQPISIYLNGQRHDLYYSNLSIEAKEAVLNIAYANCAPLNSYPDLYANDPLQAESNIIEFTYNGEQISKSKVEDIILQAYSQLSITK